MTFKKSLESSSLEFRKLFLITFTEELIKHSKGAEVSELQETLKQEEKEKKQEIKEAIKDRKNIIKRTFEMPLPFSQRSPTNMPLGVLRIPEPKLPPRLQYLVPIPTNIQIDLGKLNRLLQDPTVISIECNGSDRPIMTNGRMGARKTDILLNKEEIDQIIKKISETAKIPINEGVYKIAVGRIILSAIVSETIGSKFIIRKMMPGYIG